MRNAKAWIRSGSLSLGCLLVLLGLLSTAHAQGAASGIKGTVTDASGGVLPKANVVAEDAQKGIRRSAATDSGGAYLLTGLPPGTYNVSVELPGFGTEIQEGLVVTVGQTVILDFHLKVASVKETVEVSAAPPTVDTEKSSQSNTLTEVMIQDLPIDRRDYLTFSLLAPGVSNSTRLADDSDYRVKQFSSSGLSFYGSNGRGNSVTVDGGEANDDEGGVRLTLGQDAVQEFQINRSNYGADMGGASGATINIVSKSGTDNLHGSAFGFFRDSAMDARDPFAFSSALASDPTFSNFNTDSVGTSIKNSLSRQQYGGAIGFPITKNKTFLFVSFEGLRQNSQNSVPLLTDSSIFAGPSILGTNTFATSDPRSAQQQVIQQLYNLGNSVPPSQWVPCITNPDGSAGTPIPPASCAQLLQNYLTVNPNSGFLSKQNQLVEGFIVNQLENNGGVFPYDTRQYLASARLDHRISENDQVFLRYNYGHGLEESPDVQSLTGFSRGSAVKGYNHTLLASWFHLFSPSTSNEVRAQGSYNHVNVIPNEAAEVGLDVFGVANLGTNIFLPNYEMLRRYEFADNLTMTKGHHTFRLGGEELLRGNHTQTDVFMPGRFEVGPITGGVLSPCFDPSWASIPPYNNPLGTNPCGLTNVPGANLSSLQAFSLQFPTIFEDGFGTPTYSKTRPFTAAYWQDTWALKPNFTLTYGIRYELDTQYLPLRTPWHNFAPRVSFAWDPFNDHKTVIRGGYGVFYGQIYDSIPGVDLALGVLNSNRTSVENNTKYASGYPGSQVLNLVDICGLQKGGGTVASGNGSSPCNRQVGIYIDPIDLGTLLPGSATSNAQVIFQNLFAQGNPGFSGGVNNGGVIGCTTPPPGSYGCITAADLTAASNNLFLPTNSGQVPILSVVFSNQVNYQSPYSQQAEFGIERQLGPGFSVSASYIYSHTVHLPVAIDTNLKDPGFVSATLANGKTVSYRDWNPSPSIDPLYQAIPACINGGCFYSPYIAQNNQYTSAGSALYQGGILEVKKQFNKTTAIMANYTYSKAIDTTTDFNSDYGPQDNLNMGAERAASNFDERHKVVIAGVLDSPWRGALSGFEVAPIFNYNSGHPFNLLSGEPTNGDNHPTNGRPIGAPRNSGLGPNYANFDARISWHHKVGERSTLLITAEGFNIANRTNYGSVNNQVGPLFAIPTGICPQPTCVVPEGGGSGYTTFNVHGIAPGTKLNGGTVSSSTPLAFTSDFPKREIQLGLRLTF
ncbi:MAG: TonB-dependent receptor [Terriglobales bacterium]